MLGTSCSRRITDSHGGPAAVRVDRRAVARRAGLAVAFAACLMLIAGCTSAGTETTTASAGSDASVLDSGDAGARGDVASPDGSTPGDAGTVDVPRTGDSGGPDAALHDDAALADAATDGTDPGADAPDAAADALEPTPDGTADDAAWADGTADAEPTPDGTADAAVADDVLVVDALDGPDGGVAETTAPDAATTPDAEDGGSDPCAPNPCLHGGSCSAAGDQFTCQCVAGWEGPTCATDTDDCAPNPCLNGGTCTDAVAGFTCACAAGFQGPTCATDIDDCAPNPCLNGGTCTDGVAAFTCACAAGFEGPTCETKLSACDPNPCLYGGTCDEVGDSFECACQPGYAGPTCGGICSNGWCLIPGGTFTMGSPPDEPCRIDHETAHEVALTFGYWAGQTEVTQAAWDALMPANPSPAFAQCPTCPIQTVTWYEALAYANALSESQGLPACYVLAGCTGPPGSGMTCQTVGFAGLDCAGYRLPTEAEWERAARGTVTTAYVTGANDPAGCDGHDAALDGAAWYAFNPALPSAQPQPVGKLLPNHWGLYDVHGNVWEWVWDRWDAPADYAIPATVDPVGAGTVGLVIRGCAYDDAANFCRLAYRGSVPQDVRYATVGFRLVRRVPGLPGAACDDGDPCTESDAWTVAGICQGVPKSCPGGACLAGTCVPETTCQDGWCLIPGGTFMMGSPPDEPCRQTDETLHPVTITRSYWLGRTEVTQAQWAALMPTNPSAHQPCDACPVENVTWYEAASYANTLSAVEGLEPCYALSGCTGAAGQGMACTDAGFVGVQCTGYRLPTEAEWEYAARAGAGGAYWNANNAPGQCYSAAKHDLPLDLIGWYIAHPQATGTTQPVGLLAANPWGLEDVHGNVWDWVEDARESEPTDYALPAPTDPLNALGAQRVIRGGAYEGGADHCRLALRGWWTPGAPAQSVGFRLARTVPPVDGTPCNDGDPCTESDTWTVAGICQGVPKSCPGGACLAGTCVAKTTCQDGWCLIPSGTFTMGSPPTEACHTESETAHQVTLNRAYWMGQTEVTQAQWATVVPTNPSASKPCDTCPVETVSWYEALHYANLRSNLEGFEPCYTLSGCTGDPGTGMTCTAWEFAGLDCTGYRLPTEAEWEHAARAGTTTAYWSGANTALGCTGHDAALDAAGWYASHPSGTGAVRPVGLLAPNPWGLYDVHGNVIEWTWDASDIPPPDYGSTPQVDPINPVGIMRSARGGAFTSDPHSCRAAARLVAWRYTRAGTLGFRLARSVLALDGVACDDGNACTVGDTWFDGACVGAPVSTGSCKYGGACMEGVCVQRTQCQGDWCHIPPGTFTMGSPPDEPCREADETPHPVTITRSYWLGRTEVTQAEWSALMPTNPSGHQPCDTCPVENVTWSEAASYANALSAAEGLEPCYALSGCIGAPGGGMTCTGVGFAGVKCRGYRLPTEAEWEHAARAGYGGAYWSAQNAPGQCFHPQKQDLHLDLIGWYAAHPQATGATQPVGLLAANPWGLEDVHGNVWEWVEDARLYANSDYVLPAPADPLDLIGDRFTVRGGAYDSDADASRLAYRGWWKFGAPATSVGFRLARTVPPVDGTPCNDGSPCTLNDTWVAGQCTGIQVPGTSSHPGGACIDGVWTPAGTCLDGFCLVPEGTYTMGSPPSEPCRYDAYVDPFGNSTEDELLETVTLGYPMWVGQTEVTRAQWVSVMGGTLQGAPDLPKAIVTWAEAAQYANALSTQSGLPECYILSGCHPVSYELGYGVFCDYELDKGPECSGYRLPSAKEWEYAARAGRQTAYWNGPNDPNACDGHDATLDAAGWYLSHPAATGGAHPVAQLLPNPWGLYDVHGNVREWVTDAWHDVWRRFRGGGFESVPRDCRLAHRNGHSDLYFHHSPSLGFRVIRTIPAQ